ncbi:MAG TPA: PHB depolymerase family esterase [Bacillales bacterium]|nr:PHB depolymerase family esterase [Bacillales bacterium]
MGDDYGAVPLFACQYDQRFSYYTYVPSGYHSNGNKHPLIVAVHGTERAAQSYRDAFMDLAEKFQAVILAPLFPAGIIESDDLDAYKFLKFHGIRFDQVLLAMVDEVAEKYGVKRDKFLLHGFSGGGQFAHRFYYLYPDRLSGVSIGAPGRITYLDPSKKWPFGISDIDSQFDSVLDIEQLRKVPVQLVVGEQDIEELDDQQQTQPFENRFSGGKTRVTRIEALKTNYIDHGISVRYDMVPGVKHAGFQVLSPVKAFFSEILLATR